MRDIVLIGIITGAVMLIAVVGVGIRRRGPRFRVRGGPYPTPHRQGVSQPKRTEGELAVVPLLAVADGSWIVLGVIVLFVLAVAASLYGRGPRRRINEHPMGDRRGGEIPAPGAQGRSEGSGRDPGGLPEQRGTR